MLQLIVNHIGYILVTLAFGMVIGWQTYPLYRKAVDRFSRRDAEVLEKPRS